MSYISGRVLHRFARRPAPLLAARRLMADPWNGSRSFAVLLVCVLFAGGTAWAHAWMATRQVALRRFWTIVGSGQPVEEQPFYARTVDLIDAAVLVGVALATAGMLVALADSVANRRRTFAMLTTAGVPRAVLSRSIIWQAVTPAIPAISIALATGADLMHSFAPEAVGGRIDDNELSVAIPVPWGELARAGGIALAAVLLSATIALLFMRPSVDIREIRAS